jgi:hypothetical protein
MGIQERLSLTPRFSTFHLKIEPLSLKITSEADFRQNKHLSPLSQNRISEQLVAWIQGSVTWVINVYNRTNRYAHATG